MSSLPGVSCGPLVSCMRPDYISSTFADNDGNMWSSHERSLLWLTPITDSMKTRPVQREQVFGASSTAAPRPSDGSALMSASMNPFSINSRTVCAGGLIVSRQVDYRAACLPKGETMKRREFINLWRCCASRYQDFQVIGHFLVRCQTPLQSAGGGLARISEIRCIYKAEGPSAGLSLRQRWKCPSAAAHSRAR